MKPEYKYADHGYNDPWDGPVPSNKVKNYNRRSFKQESRDVADDSWEDIDNTKHVAWGDLPSLYCDMGPAFYNSVSYEELREWEMID